MKSYILSEAGKGASGLKQVTNPDPKPKATEVLVRVKAVSLNYRDLMTLKSPSSRLGLVPLSDGAGEVAAVGEAVTQWKRGDRVMGSFFQTWLSGGYQSAYQQAALGGSADGMLSELKVLPESGLVRIPDHLSFEEASTLPCAGLTAWNALMESTSHLKPGSRVLVLGTGGVSVFAAQFAKAAGLKVIATTSSEEKIERLKSLGVDEVIHTKAQPEWQTEVLKRTDGLGVDQVIEVGGAGTLPKSLQAVRAGGTVSLIGVLSGFAGEINPFPILINSLRLQGIYVGSIEMFERMNRSLEALQIKPVVDEVIGFEQTVEAFKKMESGSHFGKLVVRLG